MTDMKYDITERGFSAIRFLDEYENVCSIQKSSLATDEAIWLGIKEASPKILASQAKGYGIETNQKTGWISFPIPDGVLMSTRMHLTQEQVKDLIVVLQRFVDTGDIA